MFKTGGNKEAANIAYFVTFIYWGFILIIGAVFEIFDKEYLSNLFILITGLIVFFLTDFIVTKKSRTK
ncbi:hypothetical protein ACUXCC_005328 [Cytobacillus horneckiae]|uniref:hypothetical protein n=1 Tax=Cytobacillus horneckiae TaxID=549687 RepID=UPI0019D2535A|nr:hypothetical protein [Cytobacillus horneckiae]MBN6889869.1 hypothetical protein [Cytobacillus horneckiae]MCM3181140.1 hypothetical protein [Cytobacillus horneckiae]